MQKDSSEQFLTLHEFIKEAKKHLNANVWDYLIGATETETTMRRNRLALDQMALRPRVLRDVSSIDISSEVLGKRVRLPVILAPVGSLASFHPEAGIAVAKGADRFGAAITYSSVNDVSLEDVRAESRYPCIYQLYVRGGNAFVDDLARRAADCGYDAFCITVDTAVYSRRERDIAKRFNKPWRKSATGLEMQAAFNWTNVAHFKANHALPLMLKGISTAEDVRIAIDHGVDYVWVSNHGGRQLDHGRGSMDVVREILDASKGYPIKVIVDGGICRGTDVVKAMALGVEAVAIGRLYCYALAADGANGILRMLEILEDELKSAIGLTGLTSWGGIDSSYLYFGAPSVCEPNVHSAFPLLDLCDPGYGGR
ncbi:MAG: alpha-hydroxy acid oxidase [Hyphomicrobiaceae bacterium]